MAYEAFMNCPCLTLHCTIHSFVLAILIYKEVSKHTTVFYVFKLSLYYWHSSSCTWLTSSLRRSPSQYLLLTPLTQHCTPTNKVRCGFSLSQSTLGTLIMQYFNTVWLFLPQDQLLERRCWVMIITIFSDPNIINSIKL